ncbi:MAG: hypothetical protein ACRCVT_06950 [Leadbetterella sp.]
MTARFNTLNQYHVHFVNDYPQNMLNIYLAGNDRFYWSQSPISQKESTTESYFDVNTIKNLLVEKLNNANSKDRFTVYIKVSNEAPFKNTIDLMEILEEVKCRNYKVMDFLPEEEEIYNGLVALN